MKNRKMEKGIQKEKRQNTQKLRCERRVSFTMILLLMMVMTAVGVTGCSKTEIQSRQQTQEEGLVQTDQQESITETETEQSSDDDMTESSAAGDQMESNAETDAESQSEFHLSSGVQVDNIGQTSAETSEESTQTSIRSESSPAEDESETESEDETEDTRLTVAIDPGHQGSWVDMSELEPMAPGSSEMKAKASTGTQGTYSGKKEYELNLEISLLLRDILEERGYRVVLTREDHDTAISNAERALKAWEEGGDIYVRIHANGSDSSSVSGALAMVPSPSNPYVGDLAADSYLLGQCILEEYCQKASFTSQGVQYYDNMSGINWSKIPVMILEMGFMTNQSDDLRMADSTVQALMAEGIADGIDRYFTEKGMLLQEPSEEEQSLVDGCIEQIGEDYVYPSMDQGERWAVSLTDLDSGASGNLNGDVQMPSASVIKVFLMAAIYDRVCYPSTEERYIHIDESYDGELRQLISDMITVSDNTAANTLLELLGGGDAREGMAVVNQFCEEQGYTGTVFGRKFLEENPTGDNYTTANDCSRLLASIYQGTCVNQEASAKMYAFLKNQTRTWKIPQGIQDTGAQTANKTGELAGEYGCYVENDIAIVESGGQAYVLCVLSDQLRDNGTGQSQIQNISSLVYAKLIL